MKVHYWELSNYTAGKIIGRWFELDGLTYDEHMEEVKEWLADLTETTGELCEEWIVGDSEGIPTEYVDIYSINSELFDYMHAIEEGGLSAEIFDAGIYLGIDADKVAEAYLGTFDSDADYAYDLVESLGILEGVDSILSRYFDYEAFARDLMISDVMEHNGHYFDSNW